MIIPLQETPETRSGFPCTAFRWTFQMNNKFVGFIHQHQYDGEWSDSHTTITGVWLNFGRPWRWGATHAWYDGPHCLFALGPVSIQWDNPWGCRKCGGGK